MAFVEDFKKFAFKGNAVDLAVGVVIGGAFGKIVSSLVADLIMPLVALVMPTGDWRAHGFVLRTGATPKDDVVLKYGDFLGAILDFFVVALVLFVLISKVIRATEARLLHKEEEAPPTKDCPFCLEKIPVAATRCRACTSTLEGAPTSPAVGVRGPV